MAGNYILPSKINTYLQRLALEYDRADRKLLHAILHNSRLTVVPETDHDQYDGTSGHDIRFYLPNDTLQQIPLEKENELREQLRQDLNHCAASVQREYVREVILEPEDENDQLFQSSSSLFRQPAPAPESLGIWKSSYVRLFLSHRDTYKSQARALADQLEDYGISSFVAHDNIEPMTTWQSEIEKALATMEVMLAFVTDDFHQSPWTNQEIGYAFSRQTPIISLKVQRTDPAGFIGKVQAMRGQLEDPQGTASAIFAVLGDKIGQRARMQRALVEAFTASTDFSEAIRRFKQLDSVVKALTDEEFAKIAEGYAVNNQLHNCAYLLNQNGRLQKFLARCTGQDVQITGAQISLAKLLPDDDLPF